MFQMTNATVSDTEVSLRIRFFGCFDAHGTVAIAGVWSGSWLCENTDAFSESRISVSNS
jgi:hypothetical protein